MTVVTSDNDALQQQQQQQSSQVHSTFEWKNLIENFNENANSNKYIELVQSILRWFVRLFFLLSENSKMSCFFCFSLGKIYSHDQMLIMNSFSIHL